MLELSKLDAARRQLDMAIRLYFAESDPISIHTLTAAAYTVIADLSERERQVRTIRAQLPHLLTPEGEKVFRAKLSEAQNFFKHADRDASAVLRFDVRQTELLLLDASMEYASLSNESPPLLKLFIAWMALRQPNLFIAGVIALPYQHMASVPRPTFLAECLPLIEELYAGGGA